MRGLVSHHLHGEVADLPVAEHPLELVSVCRRGQQLPHSLLLVFVVGDDQGLALAAHERSSRMAWRLTNKPISRSWSAALASDSSSASPSSSSRIVRRVPSPRLIHALIAATTDRRPSAEWPRVTSSPPTAAISNAREPAGASSARSAATSSTSSCTSSRRR